MNASAKLVKPLAAVTALIMLSFSLLIFVLPHRVKPENNLGTASGLFIPKDETEDGHTAFDDGKSDTPTPEPTAEPTPEPTPDEPAVTEPPENTPEPGKTDEPSSSAEPSSSESASPTGQSEQPGETTQPGGDETGDEPGDGDTGDEPGGDDTGDEPGEDEPELICDLESGIVILEDLEDSTLHFYAYLSDPAEDESLKIILTGPDTPANGITLYSDGVNYSAPLTFGINYITVFITGNGDTSLAARFRLDCRHRQADADDPDVGAYPPTIVVNIPEGGLVTQNRNFTLTVSAMKYDGSVIYANAIIVRMDGAVQTNPTGSTVFEYQLYFERPNVGDERHYTITVLAWDDEGNSAFRTYDICYQTIDQGDEIGHVRVVLDATTVGLGILDEGEFVLLQDAPASVQLLDALEYYGYEAEYGGTITSSFYLRRIMRGDMAYSAQIPDELWELVLRDGITLNTEQHDRDSLGEFDWTMGSGWMYAVNDSYYPGKSLSAYYLSDGDTLYLRFTLSYGKDVGGYYSAGSGYGQLSGYCGLWINGTHIELPHHYEVTGHQDPTDTEEGYTEYTCSVCLKTYIETIEPTGAPDALPPDERRRQWRI